MYSYYYTNGEFGQLLTTGFSSEPITPGLNPIGWYGWQGTPSDNYTEKASVFDLWDPKLQQWVSNPDQAALQTQAQAQELEQAKKDKWAAVKQQRDTVEFGGFVWNGLRFDSDAASQQRLQLAAQVAQTNPSLTLDWTLEDNTIQTLTAQNLTDIALALGTHINAAHEIARSLREQINSATSLDQLAAIPNWI
jgi:hypothetical protein